MIILIFASCENLGDLETPGIYFYFGNNRLAVRSGCFFEMGHILSILPKLSTAFI